MSDAVLETYVRDYIATQVATGAPEIWLSWQGGEPTLLGVEFFRHAAPYMRTMADLLHRGRAPVEVMDLARLHRQGATAPKPAVGRNYGSGRKFKACCGRPTA